MLGPVEVLGQADELEMPAKWLRNGVQLQQAPPHPSLFSCLQSGEMVLNKCWLLLIPSGFALIMAKVFTSLSSVTHVAISPGIGANEETEAQSQQALLLGWGGGDAGRGEEPSRHPINEDFEARVGVTYSTPPSFGPGLTKC